MTDPVAGPGDHEDIEDRMEMAHIRHRHPAGEDREAGQAETGGQALEGRALGTVADDQRSRAVANVRMKCLRVHSERTYAAKRGRAALGRSPASRARSASGSSGGGLTGESVKPAAVFSSPGPDSRASSLTPESVGAKFAAERAPHV